MTGPEVERPCEQVEPGVLDEQLDYYRARAPEYDEWFHRRGRYDRGEEATTRWWSEVDDVRATLRALELEGSSVLELAAGTGLWTEHLLAAGASVTAVDAAPEMLSKLQDRVGTDRLTLVEADLFSWKPTARYDAVVSCFFMSHVPDERFDAFVELVSCSLEERGKVFLLDGLRDPTSTAVDHVLPGERSQTMERRLEDGRSFTIVKRFRGDVELASTCSRHGLDVEVRRTATYFQMVVGSRT